MPNTHSNKQATTSLTGSVDLDALLDDLDIADASPDAIEEIIEEIEAAGGGETAVVEEISEQDLAAVEAQMEREEVYAEQESTGETDIDAPEKAKAAAPTKGARAGTKRASTPRAPRDMNTVDPDYFVLVGDVASMSAEDKTNAKATTIAAVPNQKKIAEKFENLFTSVAAGKEPSRYVVDAFKFLNSKGSLTSTELVAHYQAAGLNIGTARSQAGQIMVLFDTVKIATRAKQALTLNKDSVIAGRLRSILGITPAA